MTDATLKTHPDPPADAELTMLQDQPITGIAEDRLDREDFARAFAAEVLTAPAEGGYVMALNGTWGSGKTSILNMAVEAIDDDAVVVEFNPWMFSGTEALVALFFEEIGKQLEKKRAVAKDVAKLLAKYGRLLAPLGALVRAGNALGAAAQMLDQLAAEPSITEQRTELRRILSQVKHRIVVVLDDVDRLRPEEVLDLVRLVRLVGDFPNTVYVLAFDRIRVEECLGDGDPARGRAYLEKIVQEVHDVPTARDSDVADLLTAGLTALTEGRLHGPIDSGDLTNIFHFIVQPLLTTPRHVRRLVSSLSLTMRLVGDEIAFADLVGIEAVRVLRPDLYDAIQSVTPYLFASSLRVQQATYQHGADPAAGPLSRVFALDEALARAICQWLFPGAQRYFMNTHYGPEWEGVWRRQRKIASSAVHRLFLARKLAPDVAPANAVDEAVKLLPTPDELRRHLRGFEGQRLADILGRMAGFISDANGERDPDNADDTEDAIGRARGLPVLLDLLPTLPDTDDLFLWSPRLVGSLVIHVLEGIPADLRLAVVAHVLDETASLSGALILLEMVGHRPNTGAGLIPQDEVDHFEGALRDRVCATAPEDIAGEPLVTELAMFTAETPEGRAQVIRLLTDDRVMLAVFVGSVSEVQGRAVGAAAVARNKVLNWAPLMALVGEDALKARAAAVAEAVEIGAIEATPTESEAASLATRYAAGYKPETAIERMLRIQEATLAPIPTDEDGDEPASPPRADSDT